MSYQESAPASRDLYERIPIYAARGFLPLAMRYFDQADRRLAARFGPQS